MTMPATMRADVDADYEKLKGFVLRPGRAGMKVRHSQAGAIGAMGFIIHFVNQQGEDVTVVLKDHAALKDEVDRIFDLEWAAATAGISGAAERRNCDMYIGYNLQHDEYRNRYADVQSWPDKLDMRCRASPAAKEAINAMFEKLVAPKDKAKNNKGRPKSKKPKK